MQKKTLVLALTGLFALPVFAQSNVQLYGTVDAYGQGGKIMGDNSMGVGSGGLSDTFLGIRGEESLGNGLKAVFVLEEGFDLGTGKSDLSNGTGSDAFSRQAYVGMKGAFGQVALGKQFAPGYHLGDYDALLAAPKVSPQALLGNVMHLSISPTNWARWDNAVRYSGTFQQFSVEAIYSAGGRETTSGRHEFLADGTNGRVKWQNDDKYGLSLKYDNGPFKAGVIYQAQKFGKDNGYDVSRGKFADKTQQEWLIGASYNFGVATVAGSYQQASSIKGFDNLDAKLWQVGVFAPVGPGNVHLAYAQAKIDNDNVLTDMGDGKSRKPKAVTLAYTQAFSKRTMGYVGFAYADYDGLNWGQVSMLTGDDNGHIDWATGAGAEDKVDKTKLFFVGMNHKF